MHLRALPYLWRTSLPPNVKGGLRFPLNKIVDSSPPAHDSFGFDSADMIYFNEFDRGFFHNLASLFQSHPAAPAPPPPPAAKPKAAVSDGGSSSSGGASGPAGGSSKPKDI